MATPPTQNIKIDMSQEMKRAFAKLTKALENIQQPNFAEINRAIREAFPGGGMEPIPEEQVLNDGFARLDDETYISKDGKVISWNDQEYVKTCGEPVVPTGPLDTDMTYCWLTVDHYCDHEDKIGNHRKKEN